jgi:hypothetical protein
MSPKGSFWTDTLTHNAPPRDSTPLTSNSMADQEVPG